MPTLRQVPRPMRADPQEQFPALSALSEKQDGGKNMKKKLVLLIVAMASLAVVDASRAKTGIHLEEFQLYRRNVQKDPGSGAEWQSREPR